MSRLDRLQISGVRAFGPGPPSTIQFLTPLTLIVGTNGSGKTTIIECLRYATTGASPPTSSKDAFVHDPKLAGEKEVLAQVKLAFVNAEGTHMLATRSMQVTVKKAKNTFKALEGSVQLRKGGERSTISSRTGEMDTMIPRYLGVSKAILESVVFCHQDDSLWPLDSSKELKQRFDTIFEASKYTKAIEAIHILRKNKRNELDQLKIHEANAKVNKDRSNKNQNERKQAEEEARRLHEEEKVLREKIAELAHLAEDAWHKASTAELVVGELRGKRIERGAKEESVQSLRDTLQELSEPDEDLQRMLEEYDKSVHVSEADVNSHKQQYVELQSQLKDARDRADVKERECGAYEEQKQSFDRSVTKRQRLVRESARNHKIRGYDADVDDVQVQAFIDKISKMARDQNAAFERARRETQGELQKAQKVLNQIYEQRSALNQSKESARKTMTSHNTRINNLQRRLDQLNYDEGATVTLSSRLKDVRDRLDKAKADSERSSWDDGIAVADADLKRVEESKEQLDIELVEATRRAGDTAQLDIRQKELKDLNRSLETMVIAHGDSIAPVVGKDWSPATIESSFQRAVDETNSAVTKAERQRDENVAEHKQVEFELNKAKSELVEMQKNLKAAQKAIRDAVDCEPQDYLAEVEGLEQSRDILKSDKESIKMITDYFNQCIKLAKEHKACRTCNRGLKDKELEVLLKNVEKEKKKLQANDDDEAQLKNYEEALKAARDVSSDFDTWGRLNKREIPGSQANISKLSDRAARLNDRIEEQDVVVHDKAEAKREVDALARNVQKIAKYSADISKVETEIRDLTSRQKATGASRGLEVIQDESKKLTEDMRNIKTRSTRLHAERERSRNEINLLELETRDLNNKLNTANFELKEKTSLDAEVDDAKSMNVEQRENIKTLDSKLEDLVPQHSAAQEKYNDIEQRGQDKDREMQAETTRLNSSVSELTTATQDIEAYGARGGAEQLARGKREAEHLKNEVTHIEQEQSRTVQRVKQLEDQLRSQADMKSRILDNQRFRRDLRRLKAIKEEIQELEKHNAEDEKAYWEREGLKYQTKRNELSTDQANIFGQLKGNDDRMMSLKADWETDYKNAAFEFRKSHVLVEANKAAIDDLGRYGGALDKAIMKYHSLKMEEINRIIEELWRKTYQGTDVDNILIRSETETAMKNKNYNYRVCMVKQDVEMDMRGRCSAGQKVLACIIIRLALAECFGVNCGMIALDEPTTNLDAENIKSLAQSLSEIIRVRRQQSNFQLIVITHDEAFLGEMNCQDYVDKYYRVSRNENQKSQIKPSSINDLMR